MDWESLDSAINELESLIDQVDGFICLDRKDKLGSCREKCFEIQDGFNSKPRYPTKQQRDAAWAKFNALRTKSITLNNELKHSESEKLFKELCHDLMLADHNLGDIIAEKTILFFDKTDADDMKRKGELLRSVRQRHKENGRTLTHEHHQEVWSRILAVQSNHDAWWGKWKERKAQRDEEFHAKQTAWRGRTQDNLTKNKERRSKCEHALAKARSHAEQLREQIASARGDAYRERVEGWLKEEEDRIRDIEKNLDQINEWIAEDERKLNE